MRIVVSDSMVPFVRGEAERFAEQLAAQLERRGHLVDLIRIPFRPDPFALMPRQVAIAEELLFDRTDLVIALRFPATLVEHPRSVVWLQGIPPGPPAHEDPDGTDAAAHRAVLEAERRAFDRAVAFYAASPVVAERVDARLGFVPPILPPPVNPDSAREWDSVIDRLLA